MSYLSSPFFIAPQAASRAGGFFLKVLHEMGALFLFFLQGFILIFRYPFQGDKILRQVYFIGAKSVPLIALVGLFTGMVIALQSYYALARFGSEGVLGGVVALSLTRELGPVLGSIMITARAGSAMAAEIGIMRNSEQIDALYTMGVNPIRYLVSPRIVAALISFPLLVCLFNTIGIMGSYITGVILLDINQGIFIHQMEYLVVLRDVLMGLLKALFFALLVITICCYQGYFVHTRQDAFGAKGVSLATTSAVVFSCVGILISDYVLTSIMI